MKCCARVSAVSYLGERRLQVVFDDGLIRQLDFHSNWQGNLDCLNGDDFLAQVAVDQVAHTLCWPKDIDLDPEVLHGDCEPATGAYFTVVSEFRAICN